MFVKKSKVHILYHKELADARILHDQKKQDNSFNLRFQIGNGRQSKRLLANLGIYIFAETQPIK